MPLVDNRFGEITGLFTLGVVAVVVYKLVNTAVNAVTNTNSIWNDVLQFMELSVQIDNYPIDQISSLLQENGFNNSLLLKFGLALRKEFPQMAPPIWSLMTLILYSCYVSSASFGALAISLFSTLSLIVALAVKWRLLTNLLINTI